MAEQTGVAVQVAKEPTTAVKPVKFQSLADNVNAILNAISCRAYEIFQGKGYAPGSDLEDWFQAERELLHPVQIQMSESDDAFEIRAEVPGFSDKDLQISVEPQRLVISGKRESTKDEKKGTAVYSEIYSDQIMRVVDLPADIDTSKVVATLKNGVLDVQLPKAAKAPAVKVEPKVA